MAYGSRNRSGASGNKNGGSAGLVYGYDGAERLRQDMEENGVEAFGGTLFTSTNHHDQPLICHAIRCEDEKAISELSKFYNDLDAERIEGLLHYAHMEYMEDDLVAFKFSLGKNDRCVRMLLDTDIRKDCCKDLFPKLVDILDGYYQVVGSKNMPLRAFSLDTVFVDQNGRVGVMPVFGVGKQFPKGYPLEAATEEADDRTDLFAAALLSLQVLSGCEVETAKKKMAPELLPEIGKQCLCIYPSGRPDLETVKAALAGKPAAGAAYSAQQDKKEEETGAKTAYPWGREAQKTKVPPRKETTFNQQKNANPMADAWGALQNMFDIRFGRYIAPKSQVGGTADNEYYEEAEPDFSNQRRTVEVPLDEE